MLARDQLSLPQVARTAATAPIQAIGDPRQQAFQRALASQLGQSLQAEVLSKLSDGSFVVRVADMAARMPLPQNVQVGSQVPLTLVALHPRPTFQVATTQGGPAFAEAGPPLPEGASPQAAPLAWLEGKEAAALTRAAALLAATQALAMPSSAAEGGAGASLSKAGKALGDVIAAAQASDTPQTAALGRTPLLGAPSGDAHHIAAALQQGMEKSGLFYESHVAEWAQGARPQAELAAEPQARGMAPPSDPATAQLINLQLNAHEQARVAWQGQLWPGQELRWEIERDAPERDSGGRDGDGDGGRAGWQSSLKLRFGRLGEVAAKVVLSGGQLHIRLDAPEAARALLQSGSARLAEALDAAGTPLTTLAIHGAIHGPTEASEQGRR
jgi:hypothetical protein